MQGKLKSNMILEFCGKDQHFIHSLLKISVHNCNLNLVLYNQIILFKNF